MTTRTANGWRWTKMTIMPFGIFSLIKLFYALKSNEFKGLVEAVLILGLGVVFSAIAFALGCAVGSNRQSTEKDTSDADPHYDTLQVLGTTNSIGASSHGTAKLGSGRATISAWTVAIKEYLIGIGVILGVFALIGTGFYVFGYYPWAGLAIILGTCLLLVVIFRRPKRG